MLRVLHFSDVHVQEPVFAGPLSGLVGKRALAALNLWLVRSRLFADAPQKLAALAAFAVEHRVDAALCTGDYTAMGTRAEHRKARRAVQALTVLGGGFCTVPGNHDIYLPDTLVDRRFEAEFGDAMTSDLAGSAVDGPFPFVRLFGAELAVIGVNSARPNPSPLRSSGRIPDAQLADPRLADRQRMVMTHYGVLREDRRPDSARHGLENAAQLAAICKHGAAVLVHGHLHHTYHHPASAERPPLFCAGSATYRGREGFWLYELNGGRFRARRGGYEAGSYRLLPEAPVTL